MLRIMYLAFIVLLVSVSICFAGTLIEDFEDGDAEGWERSPQNKKFCTKRE